eukprot:356365-Chlamydomonas_euryale.AAC.5
MALHSTRRVACETWQTPPRNPGLPARHKINPFYALLRGSKGATLARAHGAERVCFAGRACKPHDPPHPRLTPGSLDPVTASAPCTPCSGA